MCVLIHETMKHSCLVALLVSYRTRQLPIDTIRSTIAGTVNSSRTYNSFPFYELLKLILEGTVVGDESFQTLLLGQRHLLNFCDLEALLLHLSLNLLDFVIAFVLEILLFAFE